jgi:tRNA(Ile2) C34 agmatinyltransferase TiaS
MMAISVDEATCPRCHKPTATPSGDRYFWCHNCKMEFDTEDDGDIGRGRPDRIAERREEYQIRQREWRMRK